jgi:hypothetical protein
MNSQTDQILDHLRGQRTITAFEALQLYGSLRLAARIKDLREAGHTIHTEMVAVGKGKTVAEYTLIKEAQDVH